MAKDRMTAAQLAANLSQRSGVPQRQCKAVLTALAEEVKASVLDGGTEIPVSGLGTFVRSLRAAREGRNPATGEAIAIPASRAVKLKVSSALKSSE